MTIYTWMQPSLDRSRLRALLQQDALLEATEKLGPNAWNVNPATGELTFSSTDRPEDHFGVSTALVATVSPGEQSVLWGWNHPQAWATPIADILAQRAEAADEPGLRANPLPFPDNASLDEGALNDLSHDIGALAVDLTGSGPYYVAPLGNGTLGVLLLDGFHSNLTLATVATKLPRMLSTGLVRDPRTSFWALAHSEGWNFQWEGETFTSAKVSDGVSNVEVGFDDLGRITSITGSLTGEAPEHEAPAN